MINTNIIAHRMIKYYSGDPKRIQHFIKVNAFANLIAKGENVDEKTQNIVDAVSLVHDIGIKPAEEKYNSSAGKYQETEGEAPAREMLSDITDENTLDRICYLISHHHTYKNIDGIDYQILVEADFLTNLFEDNSSSTAVKASLEKIFKTKTGIEICKKMFGIE